MKNRWSTILVHGGLWVLGLLGVRAGQAGAAPAIDAVAARPYADLVYATVRPKSDAEVAQIWRAAENVLGPHDPEVKPHTVLLSRATLAKFATDGLDVKVEAIDVERMVADSYARNAEAGLLAAEPAGFGPFFNKVQPLPEIEKYLTDLAARGAGRAKLLNIGRSIEGRDIRAMVISSAPDDTSRPSIIVTGTHHPREWLSPMVVMGIIDGLINRYDSDPRAKRIVDTLNVYVVPVLNPDGYLRTFNGNRLQRKNMRVGCNVDVNRNYPTAFGQGASDNCRSETTRGAMPFSEPESLALKQLAEMQKNLRLYVDYHSSGNQVMIPYAYTRTAPPGLAKNQMLGERLASEAKLPARPAYNLAQGAGGGALDWFREKYSDSLVVELPGRGFDPPASGVAANVELQWTGWTAAADLVAAENGAGPAAPKPDAAGASSDAGQGGAGGGGVSGGVDAAGAGGTSGATGMNGTGGGGTGGGGADGAGGSSGAGGGSGAGGNGVRDPAAGGAGPGFPGGFGSGGVGGNSFTAQPAGDPGLPFGCSAIRSGAPGRATGAVGAIVMALALFLRRRQRPRR